MQRTEQDRTEQNRTKQKKNREADAKTMQNQIVRFHVSAFELHCELVMRRVPFNRAIVFGVRLTTNKIRRCILLVTRQISEDRCVLCVIFRAREVLDKMHIKRKTANRSFLVFNRMLRPARHIRNYHGAYRCILGLVKSIRSFALAV